jgi:hypothetical protein
MQFSEFDGLDAGENFKFPHLHWISRSLQPTSHHATKSVPLQRENTRCRGLPTECMPLIGSCLLLQQDCARSWVPVQAKSRRFTQPYLCRKKMATLRVFGVLLTVCNFGTESFPYALHTPHLRNQLGSACRVYAASSSVGTGRYCAQRTESQHCEGQY